MDSYTLNKITEQTNILIKYPLNALFLEPVPLNEYPDYLDFVKTPMSFDIISEKISQKKYRSKKEWYNDVCLIFENCITYHQGTGDRFNLVGVSKFLLFKFKKDMKYFLMDEKEWLDKVVKVSNDIASLISQLSPSGPRNSSSVLNYIKKAQDPKRPPKPLTSNDILLLAEKANDLSKEPEMNEDFYNLLKEAEGMSNETASSTPVNIEELKPVTQAALQLYVSSKSK